MMHSRRSLLRNIAAGLMLGSMGALGGCAPARGMTLASHVWPGYAFMFLARDEGWLDTSRVQLVETHSATASLEALARHEVVAAALTLDEVLRARDQGLPLTIVLVFDVSVGADVVLARPAVSSLADLRGVRIGVEEGALGGVMLAHLLLHAGLKADEVARVPLRVDEHLEAWQRGAIDVLITYEPVTSALLAQDAHILFDSRRIPDTIFDVLAVHRDWLEVHRKAIAHLVAVHFRGLHALQRNPGDTAFRLARHLGLPGQAVMSVYRGLSLPGIDANRSYLDPRDSRLLNAAGRVSDVLLQAGQLRGPASLTELVTPRFLPSGVRP